MQGKMMRANLDDIVIGIRKEGYFIRTINCANCNNAEIFWVKKGVKMAEVYKLLKQFECLNCGC